LHLRQPPSFNRPSHEDAHVVDARVVAIFSSTSSPSGTGLKIFLRGRKPDYARCAARDIDPDGCGELELYDHARYFTVTGNAWPGTRIDVVDCQGALNDLCNRLWPQKVPPVAAPAELTPAAPLPGGVFVHQDDRVAQCLAAMLKMDVADKSDGSFRLFAATCRCVEHDLTGPESLICLEAYAALKPFPTPWSVEDMRKHLRDAEGHARL
jgi:hypothetical protein